MPKKLISHHGRVISSLKEFATLLSSADKISYGKQFYNFCNKSSKKVFFITEGDFIVRSRNGNKIINIISAPFVIGVMPSLESPPIFLEKVDYGRIYGIEYNYFWSLVHHKEMYSDVMSILSGYHSDLLNYIQTQDPDAEIHTLNLIRRWSLFPCHIQKRFSLLYFLTNSSFISKRTVSRALRKLKTEGMIQLDRGRLSAINTDLQESLSKLKG